jgi:hypothetical protein
LFIFYIFKETFDDAIAELDTLNGNAAQKQKNAGGKQPTSQRIQKKHGKPTSIFFHPPLRTKISNLLNDKLTLEYSTEEENSSSSDGEKERTRNFQHQQWNNKFKNGGGTPKSQQKPSSPFHLSTTPKKNISAAPKSHSHSPWRKNTDHSDW